MRDNVIIRSVIVVVLFTPNGSKKIFVVIPFGPKDVPSFYTAMMKDFQREWNAEFDS